MYQKTYVMVKPGYAKFPEIVEKVKKEIKKAGLTIIDCGYVKYDNVSAAKHYACHYGKSFYDGLVKYITSGTAYGMVVGGEDAIAVFDSIKKGIRTNVMENLTEEQEKAIFQNAKDTEAGKDERITKNVIHASDGVEAAKGEIEIFTSIKENSKTI